MCLRKEWNTALQLYLTLDFIGLICNYLCTPYTYLLWFVQFMQFSFMQVYFFILLFHSFTLVWFDFISLLRLIPAFMCQSLTQGRETHDCICIYTQTLQFENSHQTVSFTINFYRSCASSFSSFILFCNRLRQKTDTG